MRTEFAQLCEVKKPASLILPSKNLILRGRFAGEDSLNTRLALIFPPDELAFDPNESCAVVYSSAGRTFLFVANVVSYAASVDGIPEVTLTRPREVSSGEARNSFRVPLHRDTGLRVTVKSDQGKWSPRAVDISLGGILMDFQGGRIPEFEEDAAVMLTLSLGDQTAELEGFVGRRDGSCYAAYFVEALRQLRDGKKTALPKISKIVDKLEAEWLSGPIA